METTKLSSKGQVIIPKAFRSAHHWKPGLELMVIDTGEGLLLKPKAPFAPSELSEVSGMFKDRVTPKTAMEIQPALTKDARRKWRGHLSQVASASGSGGLNATLGHESQL